MPLGSQFPNGLLVVHDGSNEPAEIGLDDGEEIQNFNTNFKFVDWANVANAFDTPLAIAPDAYDPRDPQPATLINGVASGDTTQTSTVLWSRSLVLGDVTFEYSRDAHFNNIEGSATVTVTDPLVPVKAELTDPLRNEFYGETGDDRTAGERKLYRYNTYGSDAAVIVLDNRSFRDQPLAPASLDPVGYDPVGLNANLPQSDGLINAKLLESDYVAVHTYGWTEFDIDAHTQALTVTTYGIPYYTQAELVADPSSILGLTPAIVSQFEGTPRVHQTV